MHRKGKQKGFSLTEVLIATAILAIGLIMIAMALPVGAKLTSIATERTIGAVAANEAFAKFQLYSRDPDGAGNIIGIDCARITSNGCMNLPSIVNAMDNPSVAPKIPSLNMLANDELLKYP